MIFICMEVLETSLEFEYFIQLMIIFYIIFVHADYNLYIKNLLVGFFMFI